MICAGCSAAVTANRFCTACGKPLDIHNTAPSVGDLVEGRSLRTYCDDAPLPWTEVCALVAAICIAVERAGEHLSNPELSPENIYVEDGPELRIKLVEASTAMWRGTEDRDTAVGYRSVDKYGLSEPKVEYFSPQRLMGKPLGPRDSVYTLGLLAYELLVGRRPFADARDTSALITAQIRQRPQLPPELEVPSALAAIVMRCLEKVPAERFAGAIELADALARQREI